LNVFVINVSRETLVNKNKQNYINMANKLNITFDYIRGITEGQGSFGLTSSGLGGNIIPTFQLKMNINNKDLLEEIKNQLGLKNKIYIYHYPGKERTKREKQAILMVRDFRQLKDIVIPFFYGKLKGYKNRQFLDWLEKIGRDPEISNRFKSLYRLHKMGAYDKNPKFLEKS